MNAITPPNFCERCMTAGKFTLIPLYVRMCNECRDVVRTERGWDKPPGKSAPKETESSDKGLRTKAEGAARVCNCVHAKHESTCPMSKENVNAPRS